MVHRFHFRNNIVTAFVLWYSLVVRTSSLHYQFLFIFLLKLQLHFNFQLQKWTKNDFLKITNMMVFTPRLYGFMITHYMIKSNLHQIDWTTGGKLPLNDEHHCISPKFSHIRTCLLVFLVLKTKGHVFWQTKSMTSENPD